MVEVHSKRFKMCAKLLSVLLIACQIILNESYTTQERITVHLELKALPEGYVTFPEDKASYKIHEDPATWDEAKERCIAEGARLAITDSVDKIEHINTMKNSTDKWLHVGIYQSNDTNEWVRVDNDTPVTTVPWAEDNPDGTGNCTGISLSENGLVDYSCDWAGEHYVCEIVM